MIACKDCIHCHYVWAGLIYCRKESISTNHYNGDPEYAITYLVRKDSARCGEEGKWFAPIEQSTPHSDVYTDDVTLSIISKLLAGEPYEVVESVDNVEVIRYVRNGSEYRLTYVGPYLRAVYVSPV